MPTWTLTLEPDRYGREQTRTVNLTVDIRNFKDRAGFPYLLMAANPHLSVRDIQEVLASVADELERPVGWISRRRWLFPGTGKSGAKRNADGNDEKAHKIMEDNPRMSANQLVRLLKDNGIIRSREWVRTHRVSVS
jgi:hypothetical protein